MTDYIKIENAEKLVRDRHSKGVSSTDLAGLSQYQKNKEMQRKREERINNLEASLEEIKLLLRKLTS